MRLIFKIMLLLLFEAVGARGQGPDYTGIQMAREYQANHNYLLAYKYLVIYRWVNDRLFEKPVNRDSREKLEATIGVFEDCLNQRIVLSPKEIIKMKGFSNQQLDSVCRDVMKSIRIENAPLR